MSGKESLSLVEYGRDSGASSIVSGEPIVRQFKAHNCKKQRRGKQGSLTVSIHNIYVSIEVLSRCHAEMRLLKWNALDERSL